MDLPSEPEILLTNDDGIDAPGIRGLFDALSSVGSVTVVAPDRDRSAVGRSLSYGRVESASPDEDTDSAENRTSSIDMAEAAFTSPVPHTDHELGYAVDGTPCDCAIVGVNALDPAPDLVVSGCNDGANLGAYVLARSGTVSAAMEAAFLGVPSIAVSMDTLGYDETLSPAEFSRAGELTASIVDAAPGTGLFDRIDYLNVNVPRPDQSSPSLEITRPTDVYEMDATLEDGQFRLTNRLWQQMANRDIPDPPDTDRHALLEGNVSISPLRIPYEVVDTPPVRNVLEGIL
ncbi:5'/3'-nucleotidase SurE [Natrarchaeobius chitinivorans]|uniref:5'-nucleotidase SurE n=1 Tax=Natrarchaeobius chitinivorans TaxID=1679083 RepID=A0A3N6MAL7_NATCH|nr:5'/3'-nucleotidase SurE [Natrarchaeobius chitinivorans]RQG93400.1 5'/3'-nucleotidase SurE [Natrarchaeobius chitinivorans]